MFDMKNPSVGGPNRRRSAVIGSAQAMPLAALLALAGCVSAPIVPQSLEVPAGEKVLLHAYAKGVQIYTCRPSPSDPAQFAWALKAPEALLFDENGTVIGSLYAGPTWENDRDGSTVSGVAIQSIPSPGSNAMPWMLWETKPGENPGLFHRVSHIQCVNTTGGSPPATGADAAHVGRDTRVRYTAEYFFYRQAASRTSAPASARFAGDGEPLLIAALPGESGLKQIEGVDTARTRLATDGVVTVKVGAHGGIWTSTDGAEWNRRESNEERSLHAVAFGDRVFVAVGNEGALLTSPDGITWTPRDSRTDNRLRGVAFGNHCFVAVGYEGTILVSNNGRRWHACNSGTAERLQGVAFGNGMFVAVGWNGVMLVSPDGRRWTPRNAGFAGRFNRVEYLGGKFTAHAGNGAQLTSPDGCEWSNPEPAGAPIQAGVSRGASK